MREVFVSKPGASRTAASLSPRIDRLHSTFSPLFAGVLGLPLAQRLCGKSVRFNWLINTSSPSRTRLCEFQGARRQTNQLLLNTCVPILRFFFLFFSRSAWSILSPICCYFTVGEGSERKYKFASEQSHERKAAGCNDRGSTPPV